MVLHYDPRPKPKPPASHERGTLAGLVVGASVVVAIIAAFTGHFALGVLAFVFCSLIAALHANAVEPGKLRAPIAAGFLAACSACAALSAVAGAQGVALLISGWLVTGLYYAGLLIGALKRLDLFQRVLALLLAAALPIALLQAPPPPPERPPPDDDEWRVELTVLEADGQAVQGARTACWPFDTPAPEGGLVNALQSELSADFSAPTDEAGRATIELRSDPAHVVFVCAAARPYEDAQTSDTNTNPTAVSPPSPVPLAGGVVHVELRFESSAR